MDFCSHKFNKYNAIYEKQNGTEKKTFSYEIYKEVET